MKKITSLLIFLASCATEQNSEIEISKISKFLEINGYTPISIGQRQYTSNCDKETYYSHSFVSNPPNRPDVIVKGFVCCSYGDYCLIKTEVK